MLKTKNFMITDQTIRHRSRLAWLIMLMSFFGCVSVTISVPILANRYVQTATDILTVHVNANQGTVRIDKDSGDVTGLIAGGPTQTIEPGSTVVTGNTETAVWVVTDKETTSAPDDDRLLRLQVYSNTIVRLNEAKTPRFSLSTLNHSLSAKLESGRVRFTLPVTERPLTLIINTPQSRVEVSEPGEYGVVVTNEATEVTVNEGEAEVAALTEDGVREVMRLAHNQRARVPTGLGPIGREGTDRNLILNSSFQEGQDHWAFFKWNVDLEGQPGGVFALDAPNGEPRLYVFREGEGHTDFKIRQTIKQDVTDLSELRLAITFRINWQTLGVCGVVGSECPLFVRINYIDSQGVPQVWQHGFYAIGDVTNETPDVCTNCGGIQTAHELVPMGQDYFYEIDFPDELALQGALPPRFIDSIELVTSGHSFEVELFDVALLAIE